MKKICDEFDDQLVALAEGKESPEASAHVAGCSDCAVRLQQLKGILSAAALKYEMPPASAILAAKNLMPSPMPRRAILVRSTLALSGTRAVSANFQAIYQVEDTQVRVMYEKLPNGWEVLAKLDSGPCSIVYGGRKESSDREGRFSFKAGDLDQTGFQILVGDGSPVTVPPAQELIDGP